MQLTPAQMTTLKTHLNANTNTVINVINGQAAAINTLLGQPFNGDNLQHIADWYNQPATSGDLEPFANLMLWNPLTNIQLLNSAVDWTAGPTGATDSAVTNSWLKWQSMTWNNTIDMTDPQVRQGIISIWGNPSSTVTNIGAVAGVLTGKLAGRRIELVLSSVQTGGVAGAWAAAHVCPKAILGALLSEPDLESTLLNG